MVGSRITLSDTNVGAAYLKLTDHTIVETIEATAHIQVDNDGIGTVVGVEVLNVARSPPPVDALVGRFHFPAADASWSFGRSGHRSSARCLRLVRGRLTCLCSSPFSPARPSIDSPARWLAACRGRRQPPLGGMPNVRAGALMTSWLHRGSSRHRPAPPPSLLCGCTPRQHRHRCSTDWR
jgi:uncharacterized protein YuzE